MVATTRSRGRRDDEKLLFAIQQSTTDNTTPAAAAPQISRPATRSQAGKTTTARKATKGKTSQVSGRVEKSGDVSSKRERQQKLMVKLTIPYGRLQYKTLRDWGVRPKARGKGYWPYGHHKGFKLGHNPWAHLNWPAPSTDDIRKVHQRLADYHQTFEFGTFVSMPAHGSQAATNVDVVIQTIFAQSTGNENAIDTHSRLCNAFPFEVDGKKYVGKMPDWHKIRELPKETLETALQQGGFQIMRAKFVLGVLNHVYKKNVERQKKGLQQYPHARNEPGAKDFVPGMLDMAYLTDPREDNSDEAVLGRLLELSGIGVKSAMCVMAFSLKRPLFVVDTHILRYCIWLGWIPGDARENAAAMFLHNYIPDEIKYDLHNQIWTHCANENVRESKNRTVICPFCGSNPPAQDRDVSSYTCPVSEFLPPLDKRWRRAYKLKAEDRETQTAQSDDVQMEDSDDYEGQDNIIPASTSTPVQRKIDSFFKKVPITPDTSPGSNLDDDAASPVSSLEDIDNDETTSDAAPEPTKSKKLNLAKLKSIRFEDVPKKQVQELYDAGFLLWEFRPMDNTFMEEWGTFDRKPRYKWERADVMDKDVAVTWEYANSVINGNGRHKWSRKNSNDIAEEQIFSALNR